MASAAPAHTRCGGRECLTTTLDMVSHLVNTKDVGLVRDPTSSVRVMRMTVMSVHHGMPQPAADQPAIRGIGGDAGDQQGRCESHPEEPAVERCIHGTRDEQHD